MNAPGTPTETDPQAGRPPAGSRDIHRGDALRRWEVVRPHVEDGVPLVRAARDAGVSLRTARRWLSRYREAGVSGLGRRERADRGRHRLPGELVALVEGLALTRPRPSAATITRQVAQAATAHDWPVPSYSTIYAIVAGLDPHLVTLAHEGPAGLRDRYELVYRRQSERPTTSGRPTTPSWTSSSWTRPVIRPGPG